MKHSTLAHQTGHYMTGGQGEGVIILVIIVVLIIAALKIRRGA